MCAGQSPACDQWSTIATAAAPLDNVRKLTRSLVKIPTTMQSDLVQCYAAAGLMLGKFILADMH